MNNLKVSKCKIFVLTLSLILLIGGICLYFVNNFNLGVDFESGISQTVSVKKDGVQIDEVRGALVDISGARVQRSGQESDNTFIIRAAASNEEARARVEESILDALNSKFGESGFEVISTSFIGSKFSSSLITTSISAVAISLLLILIYIWFRFQLAYSFAAVLTLIHDVLLLITYIIFAKIEISSITIAAILTIIGYSLNNTIVIFDRVRENISLGSYKDFSKLIDASVSQSITRTIFSSATTLAVIIPLGVLIMNADIKMFSTVLAVGIIIGIYSSTLIAGNILSIIARGNIKHLEKKN